MKPKGDWTSMRRKDLLILLIVGFLFSALTFNLGLYWGIQWGLNNGKLAVLPHHAPAHPGAHPSEPAKAPVYEAATEEDWHTKKIIPETIREAFVKSKQNALIESQLRSKDRAAVGTSIADADAYFREKKLKWGEVPQELKKLDRSIASETAYQAVPAPLKAETSGLFERQPASVKEFSPIPGQKTVQVASYATEEEAMARVKLLIAGGEADAYYSKIKVRAETWYQVSVGSFSDGAWAKKTGERMVRRSLASEFFVRSVPE